MLASLNVLQKFISYTNAKQDAQLSQRDRAAGCIIVFAERLEVGDNILRILYVYLQPL